MSLPAGSESFEVERGAAAAGDAAGGESAAAGTALDVGGGDGGGTAAEAGRDSGAEGPVRSVCQSYLSGGKIYSCCHCRSHLASHDEVISKSFQGHHGRAYLFNNLCAPTPAPLAQACGRGRH